jgi:hypothetical protein
MQTRQTQRIGKVKVYRFRKYDIASDNFIISSRLATHACIRRIRAELIRSTELEIDKKDLNADGMTEIVFGDRPDQVSPWARAGTLTVTRT